MKHFIFLFALVLSLPMTTMAQHRNHQNHEKNGEKLTTEQRINLHVKKMQLALELSENQKEQVAQILKKNPRPERLKKREGVSSDDRYKMDLKQLDHQIALQKEMKTVLSEKQFEEWKQMQQHRKAIMAHRGRRPHEAKERSQKKH
jgi:protein CpxP